MTSHQQRTIKQALAWEPAGEYTDIAYEPGDILLFGTEPTGLPDDVLKHPRVTDRVRLPMLDGRRSMNLANCAAVAVYEAWRQHGFEVPRKREVPPASGATSTIE